MTRIETKSTLPSLHKYMRKRRLLSKSGFYLEIKGNGEVACTRDDSSVYSSLLFLSVGPNFVAIIGEHSKRYLAIDEQGKIFTTMSERKECVFREFLGRNFFSLFRTCHSDSKGRGWYLSINDLGKIRAEKVSYSVEPRLHFLVKVVKKKQQEQIVKEPPKEIEDEPVWKRRSSESLSQSHSSSLASESGCSGSPFSSVSGQSEYGSPIGFLYDHHGIKSPVSVPGSSEYGSPVAFPHHSGLTSPVSVSGRSEYGSPVAFSHHSGLTSPVSVSGRSEYGSPVAFSHHAGLTSPVSVSGRSEYGSPVAFSHQSELTSPTSVSGRSKYGSPVAFSHQSAMTSPVIVSGRPVNGPRPVSMSHRSSQTSPVSELGRSEHASPESLSSRSGSSLSSKESVRSVKFYRDTPC